jgi:HEPN domain-containing protein
MTQEDKIKYWVDLSDYDLETAKAMLATKRYLYVAFMCHQVVEKIFKGALVKTKQDNPPYVHKLRLLAQQGNFYENLSEGQKDFIAELEPMNIEARYTEYKDRLLKLLSQSKCEQIITQTEELQKWIKEKIL